MYRLEDYGLGRQNLICNFRAPDEEHYQIWLDFKEAAKNRGLDVCYLALSLFQAWLKSDETAKAIKQIATVTQVINLQQQNNFIYNVGKPRRVPAEAICSPEKHSRTIRSLAFQAYVIERARDLQMSFSYRNFMELDHDFFRKLILKLKQRQKIMTLQPRTNPQYYILPEWLSNYPSMNENNAVKPKFTADLTRKVAFENC